MQSVKVISWQSKRFREQWGRLSRRGKPGGPPISQYVRELVRRMSQTNPIWGSPRIVGELHKLRIETAKCTQTFGDLRGKYTKKKFASVDHRRLLCQLCVFLVAVVGLSNIAWAASGFATGNLGTAENNS